MNWEMVDIFMILADSNIFPFHVCIYYWVDPCTLKGRFHESFLWFLSSGINNCVHIFHGVDCSNLLIYIDIYIHNFYIVQNYTREGVISLKTFMTDYYCYFLFFIFLCVLSFFHFSLVVLMHMMALCFKIYFKKIMSYQDMKSLSAMFKFLNARYDYG